MATALAVLVAVVGLPHGAADHRFARPRLEPILGPAWLPVFLLGYLAVAAAVVAGWFLAPAVTVVVFFVASAWHFGQEEPRLATCPPALRPICRLARGGLVIWIPLVFQAPEVVRILAVVAPLGSEPAIERAVGLLVPAAWAMLGIAAVAWAAEGLAAIRATGRRRRVLLADTALVASFVVLFAVASPIVGFLVYFCAWHSARGLRRLRVELGESWSQLAASLAPMTLAAVALIGLAAAVVLGGSTWNDTLVRATFVGLSGVAVPHLLLHGAAPLFAAASRRRFAGTLQMGSPA